MSLNNFRVFIIVAIFTSTMYYAEHIRKAQFVYEDTNWINSTNYSLFAIPSNRLTLISFYYNTPKIAHSINLGIHIFNGLLLSMLVEAWFLDFGWVTGSLFLVNPLATQAVAYASGRGELLALTFLLALLWYSTGSSLRQSFRWAAIGFCLILLAFIKVTILIVAIPLVIWVYVSNTRVSYLKNISMLLAVFLVPIPSLVLKYSQIIKSDIPYFRWVAVQTYATWRLLFEALTGSGLSIDHPWWLASFSAQIVSVVCVIIVIAIILAKKFSAIAFGIGWWLIAFSPRLLSSVDLGWIREHHAYVPLAGLCTALGSLFRAERSPSGGSFSG
jgi:hypothetical protein